MTTDRYSQPGDNAAAIPVDPAFHDGDDAELRSLIRRGYRFAYVLTHDAGDAEDLVQDAWCAVLRVGGPINRAYLFATIRNRFLDSWRRKQRRTVERLADPHAVVDRAAPSDPEHIAANGTLGTLLGTLRPQERAVLFLTSVEGYTAQSVADLFGWPRSTVLSMMHRARKKLIHAQS